MINYVYPALFALFVWWFSTGVIIFLDGLPRSTFKWSMFGATVVLALSLAGLHVTATDGTIAGAYWAFTFGLLAWGWQEMSFYMGYVTGPRKEVCPEGCSGWPHFVHAIQTSLWHELSIVAAAVAVVWLTWGGVNQVGVWTFMILWWMHQSAKLNVFLGVRNLNEEFLPEHLTFLKGFLTKRPMNLLFPFSVTISTVINTLMVRAAMSPTATSFEVTAATFLSMLMALAVLEHWFLVLPLPSAKLWTWGLASRAVQQPFEVDLAVGFLGAGKTTFLKRLLEKADPAVRTVALVNDFAELGIDASLLKGQGADVVELANGCICCSLRQDLAAQLRDMVKRYAPNRVVIEPSGIADVASLLAVLNQPGIVESIKDLRVYTLIDAGAFLRDFARMQRYFKVQASVARLFIINKADLVGPAELQLIRTTLAGLNPAAQILTARYGDVIEGPIAAGSASIALSPEAAQPDNAAQTISQRAKEHHGPLMAEASLKLTPANDQAGLGLGLGLGLSEVQNGHAAGIGKHLEDGATHGHAGHQQASGGGDNHNHVHLHADGHTHGHDHGHHDHGHHDQGHHDGVDLGLESWSVHIDRPCDIAALDEFLQHVTSGQFGSVERLKGIVQAPNGWLRFDVAGGRASIMAFSPQGVEQARIMAIGRQVDRQGLIGGLAACAAA